MTPQQRQQRHAASAAALTLTRQAGRFVCAWRHCVRRHCVRRHCVWRHCVRRHCLRRSTAGVRRHTAGVRVGARVCPFAVLHALVVMLALLEVLRLAGLLAFLEVPCLVGFRFVVRRNHLVVNNLFLGSRLLPALRCCGVGLSLSTRRPAARDGLGLAALAELHRGGAVGVAVAVLSIGFTRAQDIVCAWAVVEGVGGVARPAAGAAHLAISAVPLAAKYVALAHA
eukprot:scaffold40511_cov63-Phaeocystis_antarctica.AAC.5